jgi:hypothetical protein
MIYPRIVHLIKTFYSGIQGSILKTLHGVHTQVQAARTMINHLTGKEAKALGRSWIEVTVKAVSLVEAERKIKKSSIYVLLLGIWRRSTVIRVIISPTFKETYYAIPEHNMSSRYELASTHHLHPYYKSSTRWRVSKYSLLCGREGL